MSKPALTVVSSSEEGVGEYNYLDLLARVKKALETGREISVPFSDVRPYLTQPRQHFNADSIRRLSSSIDAGGQTSSGIMREKPDDIRYEIVDTGAAIEPRRVPGHTTYELIDGERRWRSIGLIPESRRPLYRAKLIVAEDDVVQYLISGITNFNREGHTALETMSTIDRHLKFGFPMNEIANLLGISEHWARQIHGLMNLKPEHQKLLDPNLPKSKQLPIVAAIQVSKIEPRLQDSLVVRVMNREISLSRLRGEVVRVAQSEGSSLRTREVEPRKQWGSFGNKIDSISRTAADAEDLIKKQEVSRFVSAQPRETDDLLNKIIDAKASLSEIEAAIRRSRST
ncbi:MAG TPA: ParB N-terminal domain-containing protein [Candidatus Paceibacterota bacterium]|nr:ParB N-terminal domain-containing protein [Candidatus Paceibacterota bacterium]